MAFKLLLQVLPLETILAGAYVFERGGDMRHKTIIRHITTVSQQLRFSCDFLVRLLLLSVACSGPENLWQCLQCLLALEVQGHQSHQGHQGHQEAPEVLLTLNGLDWKNKMNTKETIPIAIDYNAELA